MRPVGKFENYYIHDGYSARLDNQFFDDTPFKDEYQDEVYRYAQRVAQDAKLSTVVDAGTGSGYKLLKYFGREYKTLGLELEPTLTWLRRMYPVNHWGLAGSPVLFTPDLVISADVIEHIPEPNAYLEYIADMHPHFAVFSTPAVHLLGMGTEDGPPRNVHHVREWNIEQFVRYLSDYFIIDEFFLAGPRGPQVVLCSTRNPKCTKSW